MIKCNKALGEIIERKRRYFTPDEMETMSVSHGKLVAFEEMEEQGRLVILPCYVGGMVYYRRGQYVIGDTVKRIIIDESGNHVVLDCHNKEFDFEDFGETVFLTREEAEIALKGGQKNEGVYQP